MPVRMTREGRAETREDKRLGQANQQAMSAKSTSLSEGKGSTKSKEPKSSEQRKNEKKAQIREARMTSTAKRYGERYTPGMLTGGQAKIAAKAPPPNKIDEKDFAVLRAEKAKGRGMGLQDEKVKPGKVQKAALGMLALGIGGKKLMDKNKKELPLGLGAASLLTKKKKEILGKRMGGKIYKAKRGMSFSDKMKAVEDGKINKKTGKPTSMAAMREMKGFKPGESAQDFMKRRKELGAVGKALSATRIGKIALGVGAAGVAAQQYLKSKMKKKDEPKKKMGGGMMQKPMGYNKGVMVKARGCKLGRTRPTKIT